MPDSTESVDATSNASDDKTSENENLLAGIPEEGKDEETSEEPKKEEKPKVKEEKKGGDSFGEQKKKLRERALAAETHAEELENRLKQLEEKEKDTETSTSATDDEKAAREYIRKEIIAVKEEEKKKEKIRQEQISRNFDKELEEVLDSNDDFSEKQILDICEEDEVTPKQAAKILKRLVKDKGSKKPNMPEPKRGSAEPKKEKIDIKDKSMFQIGQEALKRHLSKS